MPTEASAPIESLKTRVLTALVNRRDKSHRFLLDLLFPTSTHQTIENDEIQVDELSYSPRMAPFIEPEGEAVMMPRPSGSAYTVKMPQISLKAPLSATKDLLQRFPGENMVLSSISDRAVIRRLNSRVIQDAEIMQDSAFERMEWMVSQMLQGSITYAVDNRSNFKVTFAKPAGNTIVLPTFWDEADPTPLQDIGLVKRVQSGNEGPRITDAICGREAADAIRALVEADTLKLWAPEQRNVATGNFSGFVNDFDSSGVIYLGRLANIDFWEYAEEVTEEDGTTTVDLIRPKYIEFVSRTSRAMNMNTLYFGAIMDIEAIRNNIHVTRFYTKSELKTDPSVWVQYFKTNPMTVPKRPDWYVSMKVVSG